jgi:hypothetical protein
MFPLEREVQDDSSEADEGSTGQPDGTAEGQREDVGDKGEGWLSEDEGVPATSYGRSFLFMLTICLKSDSPTKICILTRGHAQC